MGDLTKRVSPWQRSLWDLHKLEQPEARTVERQGEERYEAFNDFTPETFADLYSGGTVEELPADERAPGSDWAVKLHEQMQKVPEWGTLRDRCAGDDWWSGIGSTSLIDSLLRQVAPPQNKVSDPRPDAEVEQYLRRLAEKRQEEGDAEGARDLAQEADERGICAGDKASEAAREAELMDDTEIRNAIREAAEAANDEIDRHEAALDAFGMGYGHGAHSGRGAGGMTPRALSSVVRQNDRLSRIVQYAGRLRRIATEQQRSKPRKGTDEITGIVQGDDLGRLLVAEALDAMDPVRECLFAQKLHEQALLQYELNRTPPKEAGPIVMCLDSSGSMATEDRDAWAAAVALAFLGVAQEQGRAFALVHFGSDVLRVDEFPAKRKVRVDKLLDAVSWFAADGGTDFEKPLSEAVRQIDSNGQLEDADVIMVTDGACRISDEWLDGYRNDRRRLGFKTYSVLVGTSCRASTNERFSDETVELAEAVREEEKMHHLFGKV